jgi:putative acetyltransferase
MTSETPLRIIIDDLRGAPIAALLQEHLDDMYATSPPESVHALDIDRLRDPSITFWSAWRSETLMGCIALKAMSTREAEIKSMRTPRAARGAGVAKALLLHLMDEAQSRGVARLYLETGTEPFFAPARTLYARHGFVECAPFGDYVLDPHSVFMTKLIVSR